MIRSADKEKHRKYFSKAYLEGEAYIGILQNADGISRLISIGRNKDDDLSILERKTRNNVLQPSADSENKV